MVYLTHHVRASQPKPRPAVMIRTDARWVNGRRVGVSACRRVGVSAICVQHG